MIPSRFSFHCIVFLCHFIFIAFAYIPIDEPLVGANGQELIEFTSSTFDNKIILFLQEAPYTYVTKTLGLDGTGGPGKFHNPGGGGVWRRCAHHPSIPHFGESSIAFHLYLIPIQSYSIPIACSFPILDSHIHLHPIPIPI